jgi:pimeloyl-ACP methyl ester carboxylesterase
MDKHLVFIHGLNATSNSFNYLTAKLNLPSERVTCINYTSQQELLLSLHQVDELLPSSGELVLIGHSLGGIISTLLAHKYPERVKQVITIASPFGGSKAAIFMQWIPGTSPVLQDITPYSRLIKLSQSKPAALVHSIITQGASIIGSSEPSDGVITVASQLMTPAGKHTAKIRSNHFEVLMMPRTAKLIQKILEIKPHG